MTLRAYPLSAIPAGLFLLAACLALASPAGAASKSAPAPAPAPTPPAAIGSVWVTPAGAWYRNTPRIDLFIEDLRAAPFSEALIRLVDAQACYYNSLILPKAAGIPDTYDPLDALLKGLHGGPNPVKLIAWIDPILAGNVGRPQPATSTHVTVAHPDWLSRRADGTNTDDAGNLYLELGLPEVRLHLASLVRELVRGYPVDGVCFDPMGDPGADWGFHPTLIEAWRVKTGKTSSPGPADPSWIALRAEAVSLALADMVRAARETRPSILIGVAARTDGPAPADPAAYHNTPVYTVYHQDWPAWLAAPGATGRLYLKDFKAEAEAKGAFEGWMKFALDAARPTGMRVMVGVAGRLNESLVAMGQLRKAVEAGAAGVVLDDYDTPVREGEARDPFLNAIRNTVLSPDYLATIAAIRRSAQLSPDTRASTATRAAALPIVTTATQAAAATSTTADLALPPPPPPETAVAAAPGPGPVRRATPADILTATTATRGAAGEVVVRSQRTLPPGAADAATSGALNQRPGFDAATRRQMLEELTSDPILMRGAAGGLLQPGDQYKAYLKERFGNIFD